MQLLYIFLEYFVNKLNEALFYLDYVIHIQILSMHHNKLAVSLDARMCL